MDKIANTNHGAAIYMPTKRVKKNLNKRIFAVTSGCYTHCMATMGKGEIQLHKKLNKFLYKSPKRLILGDFKLS